MKNLPGLPIGDFLKRRSGSTIPFPYLCFRTRCHSSIIYLVPLGSSFSVQDTFPFKMASSTSRISRLSSAIFHTFAYRRIGLGFNMGHFAESLPRAAPASPRAITIRPFRAVKRESIAPGHGQSVSRCRKSAIPFACKIS